MLVSLSNCFSFLDECLEKDSTGKYKVASAYNNETECKAAKGEWMEFSNYLEEAPTYKSESVCLAASRNGVKYVWGRTLYNTQKSCLVALDKPDCEAAAWSRDNHLGNGKDGQPLRYTWSLPHFPSGNEQRCVLRIR